MQSISSSFHSCSILPLFLRNPLRARGREQKESWDKSSSSADKRKRLKCDLLKASGGEDNSEYLNAKENNNNLPKRLDILSKAFLASLEKSVGVCLGEG